MYVNDGKYIPYTLSPDPMGHVLPNYRTLAIYCFFLKWYRWFLHYTHWTESHVFFFWFWDFFVKQFLFEKRCRWNCETPAAFLFGEVPLMIFGRDDSSFPVFEAFAAFFWIVNIPMSCWIEPRKRRRTNMGALAIHQNETSPPKMGRLNLPPIHSDS